MKTGNIQIRDPFILPLPDIGKYVMYGTTDPSPWEGKGSGFDAFTSRNLEDWDGPYPVFRSDVDFWGEENFWAPEVHYFQQNYYMLATFYTPGFCRGTGVLISNNPLGPFKPHSKRAVTPEEWESLDGTLFVEQGKPYMVFCHEWRQVHDGQMALIELSEDLSNSISKPKVLFSASELPWAVSPYKDGGCEGDRVTDGPFFYRDSDQELWMLWSTHGPTGYAITASRSKSGSVMGPYIHEKVPFFSKDGGHGMVFTDFSGQLTLAMHSPNNTPFERAMFMDICFQKGNVIITP